LRNYEIFFSNAIFFTLCHLAASRQRRLVNKLTDGIGKEVTDVTDVYAQVGGAYFPISKFAIHENNKYLCNESYLQVRYFRINETNNERIFYYGWLKQSGVDNRIMGSQETSKRRQLIKRLFVI